MQLERIDWLIVLGFFGVALTIGAIVSVRAGRSTSDFFLSGRHMPWWMLGFSMVATTFSTDTPNLVTDIVRQNGVAGNWVWWAFLLTGMLTVFIYAKLWRRSGVMTDVEFYELRYSGKTAAVLRGFRALYLGIFFNVVIMGAVTLAAIKIGNVMFGFSAIKTIAVASVVTVIFSVLGGLRAVILTDVLLFVAAMVGAVAAAVVAVNHPDVGGLAAMLAHPNVADKLAIVPPLTKPDGSSNWDLLASIFIVPLAVQWWAAYYPGAEPGGGGYIAQRMLAAKDEKHAMGATLFFNAAHYALRPWPWILVALASLIVFPDLASLQAAFPNVDPDLVRDDMAYPAMLTFLPHGLLGLVVASLAAAYMSTISTHLNWGSSYVVNDFWKRFVRPEASERELVRVGRCSTVVMMAMAAGLALTLENAFAAFNLILQIGAGTGLIFILRWFWWRINAASELTAMIVSLAVALGLHWWAPEGMSDAVKLIGAVAVTTAAWLAVAFLTPPTEAAKMRSFYRLVKPGGPGWRRVIEEAAAEGETLEDGSEPWSVPMGIVCMLAGCVAVYGTLFATGYWLYGRRGLAIALGFVAAAAAGALYVAWKKTAVEGRDAG